MELIQSPNLDDVGADVLTIIIYKAGPHYVTRVCKKWRNIAKNLIEKKLRYTKEWSYFKYRKAPSNKHKDFVEAVADSKMEVASIHEMVDKFVIIAQCLEIKLK